MQVLKFGGSSVANAANISKCAAIIHKAIEREKTVVVVSALGGITDSLLHSATAAAAGDEGYLDSLKGIEQRHLDTVRELIPVTGQSSILTMVKKTCNELEDIFKGIFLLHELSARTKDCVLSFGELLSSKILAASLAALDIANTWKDSRDLVVTDSRFGHAQVDFPATRKKITAYFQNVSASLFVVPGFIA
jgi:aspartokinase/homoserine dehydrogenase 1